MMIPALEHKEDPKSLEHGVILEKKCSKNDGDMSKDTEARLRRLSLAKSVIM